MKQEIQAEVLADLQEFEDKTPARIGANLPKNNVRVSNPSRQNIGTSISSEDFENIRVNIHYRDSLRFTDMGVGRGYYRGRRISREDYEGLMQAKTRKPKRITNRPSHASLHKLAEQVGGTIVKTGCSVLFDTLKENINGR